MLVDRATYLVKRGRRSELRQIGAAELAAVNPPHAVRTLQPRYGGSHDILVCEFEFADLYDLDEYWAEWGEMRGDAFWEKVNPLIEHISSEIWMVCMTQADRAIRARSSWDQL